MTHLFFRAHFRVKPRSGVGPVPISGCLGNTEDFGGLSTAQPDEVAELHQPPFSLVQFRELPQRFVQRKKFINY